MNKFNLDSLFDNGNTSRELDDVFSGEVVSRYEAISAAEREKRMQGLNASEEFGKLLTKTEILDVFVRLKDR